jgi:hypothetical protein
MKDSRRKVLKKLSIGGASLGAYLPVKWTKPVVDSVFLPAHAQTSGDGCPSSVSEVVTLNCDDRPFEDGVNDGWFFPYRIVRDSDGCLSFENGNFNEECAVEIGVGVQEGTVTAIIEMNNGGGLQTLVSVSSGTSAECPDLTPTSSTSDSVSGQCTTPGGVTFNYEATVSIQAGSSNLGTSSFVVSDV